MTKPNEKRRVFDHIANFSEQSSIEELYEELTTIYNDFGNGRWTDINIEFPRSEYDEPMVITGYRLETDKEYADRLKYEAKCEEAAKKRKANEKKKKEENDRKEYERLKKKFEKTEKKPTPQLPGCIYRGEKHDFWQDTEDGRIFLVCNICKMEKCPKCENGVIQVAQGTEYDIHGCNRCDYGFTTENK